MAKWFGILNVDKPAGVTSREVVDRVAAVVRPSKAGHAGTLDPLATGVLVVGVGPATRLVEYVQRMPKCYEAKFLLGCHSDTEDVEGTVVPLADAPVPPLAAWESTLPKFVGPIRQRPPAYSAIKVGGRRSYDLARRGEAVDLESRPVTVHGIELLRYEYPELALRIECAAGTYIRSLGRDIAEALGTSAVMSALVRTAVGDFRLADACPLNELSAETLSQRILSARRAVSMLPQVELADEELALCRHGLALADRFGQGADELAAFDRHGELAAILVPRGTGHLGPSRNFTN
jgi:tRNA pseudouridine55 synthase